MGTATAAALVQETLAANGPLLVQGNGTRSRAPAGDATPLPPLPAGILQHDPAELVVTALAGTPLSELEAELATKGQWLACEPPQPDPRSTLGGAVACGWSGPGRPWNGALRDAVLGVELVNGLGEHLRVGGQVMKNVAGYDISRLLCGSAGRLGVVLAVSLRLWPVPPRTLTVRLSGTLAEAAKHLADWLRQPLPITGTCWVDGSLFLRLAGSDQAVAEAHRVLRGEEIAPDAAPWTALRDGAHPFLDAGPVQRVTCAPADPLPDTDCMVTWGGAERWLRADPQPITLSSAQQALEARIRSAFDPDGRFLPAIPVRPGEP